MKSIILIAIGLAVVVSVSGFFHHGDHHEHHEEEHHEEEGHEEGHSEGGEEGHKHHHHHHHHKHHHKGGKKHLECKGKPINKNKELHTAKKECHHEFKQAKEDDVKDRQRGLACKSLCSGKKIGMFDEEGMIVQSKADELVDSMIVSTEAQTEIKEKIAECANNSTELIGSGPSDNKCSNYKPYFKCLWMSAMEVCVPHFDPEDWE